MPDRATVRLQLLLPCLKVRQAQLQAARSEASSARVLTDRAAAAFSKARERQELVFDAMLMRLSADGGVSADDLRMWRAAAAKSLNDAEKSAAELRGATDRLETQRQQTAYAESICRKLAHAVKIAGRASARFREERVGAAFEDLWPHRKEIE